MPCCSRVFNWETEIRDKKRQDANFIVVDVMG